MMKLITLAALLGIAGAACPNGCSGHGVCGTGDVCKCYNSFHGGDCSYRKCPTGISFTAASYDVISDDRHTTDVIGMTPGGYLGSGADTKARIKSAFDSLYPKVPNYRAYTTCSSRGTCDHATGQCKCFEGYEGVGCRRTTCPNKCSGHGRCLTNWEVTAQDSKGAQYMSYNHHNDQQFDQGKTQQCQCDRGFGGYDCSTRLCPLGDDPTTECGSSSEIDVQLVQVKGAGTYFFTLTFEDMFGGKYTTRPINGKKCVNGAKAGDRAPCNEVQFALQELPNFAIPSVEVDTVNLGTGNGYTNYVLSFSSKEMAGKQNTITCDNIENPNTDGAAPKYTKATACFTYNVGDPEFFKADGTQILLKTRDAKPASVSYAVIRGKAKPTSGASYSESSTCSNKGGCDGATGVCKCADGHFGEACEEQSTYY